MPITSAADATPAGLIKHHAGTSAPAGYLKCNGAAVSRSTYAALFLAIGTLYGAGDGLTTFNVPEVRGEFLRAIDDGRGVDVSRAFNTPQADDFKSHSHGTVMYQAVGGGLPAASATATNSVLTATTAVGGTETRPRNVAFLAVIKY